MKSLVRLIIQAAMVVGLAVGVFVVIEPQIYIIVGVLTTIVTMGLTISTEQSLEKTAEWILITVLLSLLFGVFWPSLPIIAVWGGVLRRRASSPTAPAETGSPSDQAGISDQRDL